MSNTEFDPAAVARRIAENDAADLFVLDVRNEDDYEEWRIDGSTNVPIYDELLEYDYSTLEGHLDELPKDTEIAVVCVAGITSARAAEFLREHGFDAKSVDEGMNGWGRVHRQYDVDAADGVVQIVRPGTGCVSYLAHDGGGGRRRGSEPVRRSVSERGRRARPRNRRRRADSHAHADHVSGARRLAGELDVPYYLHGDDAGDLEDVTELADGETISVGDRDLEVLHTPDTRPAASRSGSATRCCPVTRCSSAASAAPDLEDS